MFPSIPRSIFRKVFPYSIMITRTAAQTSKQCYRQHFVNVSRTSTVNVYTQRRLYSQQVGEAMTVDYSYVKNAVENNNILIVDVREPDEIKEHGKIPNSINIPLGNVSTVLSQMNENDFQQTFKRQKPTETTEVIFYCMIGKRSAKAQDNAQKLGFRNVKNYLGSYTDWAEKTK